MKTHIFIVGQLRFKDEAHLFEFKKKIKAHEVYICTYEKYRDIALSITENLILVPNNHKEPQGNIYQWYLLDKLISRYINSFGSNDAVYRIRTDVKFTDDVFLESNSNEVLKMETDYIFSSKASLFKSLFSGFYKKVKSEYFFPEGMRDTFELNYDNLILSKNRNKVGNTAFRWTWFSYPEEIITTKFRNYFYPMKFDLLLKNIKKFKKQPKSIRPLAHNLKDRILPGNRKAIIPRKDAHLKNYKFSSEKMLIYHSLERCPVSNYEQKIELMEGRKKWPPINIHS